MRRIKELVPRSWRLKLQLGRRQIKDYRMGVYPKMAAMRDRLPTLPHHIQETQPIRPSNYFENKVHNLRLGAARINQVLVQPGHIFSYWHIIGAPAPQNGFREGRNLINGVLQADYGGGLCQLSGILYFLALRAGLEVLERHHHSVDIYTEEERFCPLGSDAAVVYGYKDLRLRNTYSFPIAFSVQIGAKEVHAQLEGESPLKDLSLEFRRTASSSGTLVRTLRQENGVQTEVCQSFYR